MLINYITSSECKKIMTTYVPVTSDRCGVVEVPLHPVAGQQGYDLVFCEWGVRGAKDVVALKGVEFCYPGC